MSTIDAIIVVVYLAAMMFVGYFVGKDNESQEDYFLAGRSMHWLPVMLSISATMISANSFVGGPGWAYTDGIRPFVQNITVPLACFFAIWFAVPVFYHLRLSSVYEYMEKRMGGGWTRNLAVAQFFINALIQVSSMVFIPSLIIQTITGWNLSVIVTLVVLCAIIYTIMGGIKAVIWTDAIQMVVLWTGIIIILVTAFQSTGLSVTDTLAVAAEAGHYQLFDFSTDITVTNTFLASCFGIFMWTRYFCFDQAQIQRILTSSSVRGIKRSFLTSSIMMNVMFLLMLFVGTILFVYYGGKEFATSNEIMIGFILNDLPVGILGLIIAAVFAAAMSSVDSLLNSMTTVFTKDIYEKYFAKEKNVALSLRDTMIVTCVLGVFVIAIVILGFSDSVSSVLNMVGRYVSYFSGPALGSFLLAMFTKKANDKGTFVGFLFGFGIGFYIATTYGISWLINPFIGCTLTVIFGLIFSSIIPASKEGAEAEKYTAKGIRQSIIDSGKTSEDGVSLLPFSIDKYGIGILVFFILQYVVFFALQGM